MVETDKIRDTVRERYAEIAMQGESCCSPATSQRTSCCGQATTLSQSCCGPTSAGTIALETATPAEVEALKMGYSSQELDEIPEGANLGLGCGNPVALASLQQGEVVLDLGSGAGIDCFLAGNRVGASGRVIGVDMTPQMITKARQNATKVESTNVEFRLGEIEALPVADNAVDAIISNCVINLSTDKERVFREAFRVTKPGGRLMVSDVVLTRELPDSIRNDPAAYAACIAGALLKADYLDAVRSAGFEEVKVLGDESGGGDSSGVECGPVGADAAISVNVHAVKPHSSE